MMFAIFGLDDAVLVGLLATAAGAAASYAGQRKASKEQQQVMEEYRGRNKAREAQAAQTFSDSLSQSGRESYDTAAAEGQARRESAYSRLDGVANGQALPTTSTGNRLIQSPVAVNRASVKNTGNAWNKLLGTAQAKLGATADWKLGQAIKDNRVNQDLARIGTDAQSDLNNVVPLEMNQAAHKGDALQGWGSLLSAVGTLSGVGGALSGGGAAANAANAGNSVSGWGMAPWATSPLGTYAPGTSEGGGMWSSIMPRR